MHEGSDKRDESNCPHKGLYKRQPFSHLSHQRPFSALTLSGWGGPDTLCIPSDLSKYGGGVCFWSSNMLNSPSPTILFLAVAVGDRFCFSF